MREEEAEFPLDGLKGICKTGLRNPNLRPHIGSEDRVANPPVWSSEETIERSNR